MEIDTSAIQECTNTLGLIVPSPIPEHSDLIACDSYLSQDNALYSTQDFDVDLPIVSIEGDDTTETIEQDYTNYSQYSQYSAYPYTYNHVNNPVMPVYPNMFTYPNFSQFNYAIKSNLSALQSDTCAPSGISNNKRSHSDDTLCIENTKHVSDTNMQHKNKKPNLTIQTSTLAADTVTSLPVTPCLISSSSCYTLYTPNVSDPSTPMLPPTPTEPAVSENDHDNYTSTNTNTTMEHTTPTFSFALDFFKHVDTGIHVDIKKHEMSPIRNTPPTTTLTVNTLEFMGLQSDQQQQYQQYQYQQQVEQEQQEQEHANDILDTFITPLDNDEKKILVDAITYIQF
jgi:hypothetical protein